MENPKLTKREYFAAMAMQGLLAADLDWGCINVPDAVAAAAVRQADELIKALNK